jgi:hypothetical protein
MAEFNDSDASTLCDLTPEISMSPMSPELTLEALDKVGEVYNNQFQFCSQLEILSQLDESFMGASLPPEPQHHFPVLFPAPISAPIPIAAPAPVPVTAPAPAPISAPAPAPAHAPALPVPSPGSVPVPFPAPAPAFSPASAPAHVPIPASVPSIANAFVPTAVEKKKQKKTIATAADVHNKLPQLSKPEQAISVSTLAVRLSDSASSKNVFDTFTFKQLKQIAKEVNVIPGRCKSLLGIMHYVLECDVYQFSSDCASFVLVVGPLFQAVYVEGRLNSLCGRQFHAICSSIPESIGNTTIVTADELGAEEASLGVTKDAILPVPIEINDSPPCSPHASNINVIESDEIETAAAFIKTNDKFKWRAVNEG